MQSAANMDSKIVFAKIVGEFFQNIFFFGLGCVVIVAIAIYLSWWLAFVMFLGFTLIVIFSVLHQVVLLGTNFVYLYAILTGKEAGRLIDYGFLAGANLVQLLEMGLLVILNLAIYQTLYG